MSTATVNGTTLYYERAGSGDPVLLVPGLGATTASFGGVVPALVDGRFDVVAVDLRGAGRSGRPVQPYSMELWAADLVGLLDHLEIERAHVVGSSLGGCVAQALAVLAPERVRSLVLAASFAEPDRVLELNYRVRIALIELAGMESQLFADFVRCSLFGRTFLATEEGEAVSQLAVAMLRDNEPSLYLAHLEALLAIPAGFTDRLRDVTCPALVLCGEEDVLTVPALSARLADVLPNATLVVQPRCGHANLVERADACAAAMVAFFRGPAAAPRSWT